MKKGIITYFAPFAGRNINSSKEVALSLSSDFEKIELPVSWEKSAKMINEILKQEPRYLIMLVVVQEQDVFI